MVVIHVNSEARAALEASRTIRCICETKYHIEEQHPSSVEEWAEGIANATRQAILRDLGRKDSHLLKQVLMVSLGQHYSYVCFDLFLHVDDEDGPSREICRRIGQPIYCISSSVNGTAILRQNKVAGAIFDVLYHNALLCDKGELPFFMHRGSVYNGSMLVDTTENTKNNDRHGGETRGYDVGEKVDVVVDGQKQLDAPSAGGNIRML